MARRTDSNNPADWLYIASGDLEGVRELASRELAFAMCVSKLADSFQPLCEELAERYFTDRYPGFDLEDEDWSRLRRQADQIAGLVEVVNKRIGPSSTSP